MNSRIFLFLIMLLFCFGASAQTETQSDGSTAETTVEHYDLSLDQAKEMAVDYNYDLRNASLAIQQSVQARKEALAAALPQIDANVDYNSYLGEERVITGIGNVLASTSNLSVSASAFFNGSYVVGLQLAKMTIALNEKTAEKTDLDVKQMVAEAYYAILLSEKTKEILEQNLENVSDVYEQTEQMYRAGVSELTDVDQLSIQVTLLESSLRTTNRQIESAYDILKLQIGLSPYAEVELTQTLADFFEPESFYAALLRAFNLEDNVDYQLIDQQEKLSDKQVTLAKMEYVPTLSATYVYLNQLMAPEFNMASPNSLVMNLSIPIFSSGERKAKVNQAKIGLETAQNTKRQLSDALVTEDRTIKRNLQTALDQFEAQQKNVTIAKRVYDNINRKYHAGMVSSLDLTTANTNYLDAESSYIQSMLDVLQAYVELQNFYSRL